MFSLSLISFAVRVLLAVWCNKWRRPSLLFRPRRVFDYSNIHKEPPDALDSQEKEEKKKDEPFFFSSSFFVWLFADCAELPPLSFRQSFPCWELALFTTILNSAAISRHEDENVQECGNVFVARSHRLYKEWRRRRRRYFFFLSFFLTSPCGLYCRCDTNVFERPARYRLLRNTRCLFWSQVQSESAAA